MAMLFFSFCEFFSFQLDKNMPAQAPSLNLVYDKGMIGSVIRGVWLARSYRPTARLS